MANTVLPKCPHNFSNHPIQITLINICTSYHLICNFLYWFILCCYHVNSEFFSLFSQKTEAKEMSHICQHISPFCFSFMSTVLWLLQWLIAEIKVSGFLVLIIIISLYYLWKGSINAFWMSSENLYFMTNYSQFMSLLHVSRYS